MVSFVVVVDNDAMDFRGVLNANTLGMSMAANRRATRPIDFMVIDLDLDFVTRETAATQ